jgi:hypothetical protein
VPGVNPLPGLCRAARTRKFSPQEGVEIVYTLPSGSRVRKLYAAMHAEDGDEMMEALLPLIKDWSGVTEAMLLGSSVGAASPAVFDQEVARYAFDDRPLWIYAFAAHAATEWSTNNKRLEDQSGN